ncbi:Nn.00g076440.m01.CDS01 [Neocucurbitaria sp. VM-36]
MRVSSSILAATGLLSTANAAIKGFNYGANFNNDQAKTLVDFEYEFNAAKQLPGTDGWTSARLYTMIQHGTQNTVIEAIQAAINTNTTLLLGLWASAGQQIIDNEITALKAAISQYGTAFTDLVVGISVGSEDLYRITPTGIENKAGAGAQPNDLVNYVQQTRNAISGTSLQGKPIGHVDTWTVYVNASNNAVISALDFIGMDAYPYFQTTMANSIGSASQLFFDAYHATVGAAQGKPVWVTETGWPVSGETLNQAEANSGNARIYWEDVTCQLVKDNVNLYYYTLQDVQYGNPVPSFGIKPAGDLMQVQPLFDLSCPASAKPSWPIVSPTVSSSSTGALIGTGTSPQLSTTFPTPTPTLVIPVITFDRPTPTVVPSPSSPSSSGLSFTDLPIPDVPRSLPEPFEAPHLIIPIDKADPTKVVGNGYNAQLSPTISTVFVYDINPIHKSKTCTLVFQLPPPFQFPDFAPVKIRAPGGISVSRLSNKVSTEVSAQNVGTSSPVSVVPVVQFGQQYNIASAPCETGQRVGYQVDSIYGLSMDWFQMTNPPLGLFMLVS